MNAQVLFITHPNFQTLIIVLSIVHYECKKRARTVLKIKGKYVKRQIRNNKKCPFKKHWKTRRFILSFLRVIRDNFRVMTMFYKV